MKKLFFSVVTLLFAVNVFSQDNYPCANAMDVANNGNGGQGCPSKHPSDQSYRKDGLIVINFTSALPANVNAPDVVTVQRMLNETLQSAADMKFLLKKIAQNRLSAEYCFYSKNNSNLFNGSHAKYVFTFQYEGQPVQTCGPVNEDPVTITLPVKWVSFTATQKQGSIRLEWQTAAEQNSKGFHIQKKLLNSEWTSIGYVASASLNGFSEEDLAYTYQDKINGDGMVQYRLMQVDLDGRESFSEIRTVELNKQASIMKLYPNPSLDGSVNLSFSDADALYSLQLMDVMGRTIKISKSVRNNFSITGLKKGQYVLIVKDSKGIQVGAERLIIQ